MKSEAAKAQAAEDVRAPAPPEASAESHSRGIVRREADFARGAGSILENAATMSSLDPGKLASASP